MNLKKATAAIIIALLFSSLTTFLAQKHNLNLVFIGDSITYGAGLPYHDTQAPPVICANYLKAQAKIEAVDFSNQGHSGYTTLDFLPDTKAFNEAENAAKAFTDQQAELIFSIKLGTNDSAVKGPHGAPASVDDYRTNLKAIIDKLLADFPDCTVIIQHPVWYSPNTYNGSMYLQEGLSRLQTYMPVIDNLAKTYPDHVFVGDTKAFKYFKENYLTDLRPEQGKQGTFYLHPNQKGAVALGEFWGEAIVKVLR